MSEASAHAREALDDARSGNNQPAEPMMMSFGPEDALDSPLDRETLDEQASTQMGSWDNRRRTTDKGE